MSAQTTYPSKLSWDEFLALPQETKHAALIDGEVVVNPPNRQHQRIVANLCFELKLWTGRGPGRGEVSMEQPIKITERRGYQADVEWYPEDQCGPVDESEAFAGDPALIVEVLSPSTRSRALVQKRADYELVGITEVWFVDPVAQTVIVCRRARDVTGFVSMTLTSADKLTSPLFDGFAVTIGDLFVRGR